jgi:hypothetical protein
MVRSLGLRDAFVRLHAACTLHQTDTPRFKGVRKSSVHNMRDETRLIRLRNYVRKFLFLFLDFLRSYVCFDPFVFLAKLGSTSYRAGIHLSLPLFLKKKKNYEYIMVRLLGHL